MGAGVSASSRVCKHTMCRHAVEQGHVRSSLHFARRGHQEREFLRLSQSVGPHVGMAPYCELGRVWWKPIEALDGCVCGGCLAAGRNDTD